MSHVAALALLRQRDDLVVQISIERAALAQNAASLRRPLLMIDKVLSGIQYLKTHPEALLLPVVITAVSRPQRLITLAISGFGLWRMAQIWRRRILS